MSKRCKRPSWDDVERFVRLAAQVASLIELIRRAV
jgi:hypothetical protein